MSGKNYKVLVVDDSEINRTILNEILRSEYEIIEAESGAKRLGISRVISDPLENEEVKSISNGSLARLVEELSAATAENPEVSIKGSIVDDEKEVDCEYRCKTLWSSGEIPVKTGVAGVIIC